MPSVMQYQALRLPGWEGGLNKNADSSRLEPNELSEALNMRLGPRGEVRLRSGYSRFDTNINSPVFFLYPYRALDGTDFLIAVDSTGDIWNSDPSDTTLPITFEQSPFTHSTGGGSLSAWGVGFASAYDKLYVTSKGSQPVVSFEWDGADGTWAEITTIPRAKILAYRHGRLFAINDEERPSSVYHSSLNNPEDFADGDYLDVNPDDGYEINAAEVFGDDLICFKDNAVWKISGRTPSSFGVYKIDSHRGCVAPRALCQLRGRLFFLDRDTGIWAFDGAGFELVSEPINDFLLDNLYYEGAHLSSAYAGDDRAYFSVPSRGPGGGQDAYWTFVYDGETGAWTRYDTGFHGRTYYLDERYLGLSGADGVYYADEDSTVVPPSSTDLVGTYRTGWFDISGPGMTSRVRRMETIVKAPTTVGVVVNMYADYNEDTPVLSRSFQGGPAPSPGAVITDERRIALDGWGGRYSAVMFEFVTDDSPFQMNNLTLFYTGNVDVRGER